MEEKYKKLLSYYKDLNKENKDLLLIKKVKVYLHPDRVLNKKLIDDSDIIGKEIITNISSLINALNIKESISSITYNKTIDETFNKYLKQKSKSKPKQESHKLEQESHKPKPESKPKLKQESHKPESKPKPKQESHKSKPKQESHKPEPEPESKPKPESYKPEPESKPKQESHKSSLRHNKKHKIENSLFSFTIEKSRQLLKPLSELEKQIKIEKDKNLLNIYINVIKDLFKKHGLISKIRLLHVLSIEHICKLFNSQYSQETCNSILIKQIYDEIYDYHIPIIIQETLVEIIKKHFAFK